MFNYSHSVKVLISTLAVVSTILGTSAIAGMKNDADKPITEQSQTTVVGDAATIVDIATSAGSFDTLVAALEAADLVDVLEGTGPFTVFAPTDEAFAALPEETLADLLKPENKDKLVKILTYHVVPGTVMSTDLVEGKVATVEGSEVEIQLGEEVKVDDAQVVTPDIKASNGVIHVIDKVIIPSK